MVGMLYFYPLHGIFDVKQVENYLLALPHTFRDPANPAGPYFICGDEGSAAYYREERLKNPAIDLPYTCLVSVAPGKIVVRQLCSENALRQARQFVVWLLETSECRVTDDYGNDWTEKVKSSVDVLYRKDD